MEPRRTRPNMKSAGKAGLNVKLESIRTKSRASPTLRGANNAVLPNINARKNSGVKNNVATFEELVSGKYTKLPPKNPTEVRIFLSSTFSDMSVERNILAKEVYPKLREYCDVEHNLDFSVVDMRWGVTDVASIDHSPVELCMREIDHCQQVGLGPTFVAMLGDRYGNTHIPKYILEPEFEVVLKKITVTEDRDLVIKWYKKDLNAIPPHYQLQPIDAYIQNYGKNTESRAEWHSIINKLNTVVRTAVDEAHKMKELSDERKLAYHVSVTELEIEKGLLEPKNRNDHCLCFIRSFIGLDNESVNESNSKAPRYIECISDGTKNVIDNEVAELRRKLKDDKIESKLAKSKLFRYPPQQWSAEGMNLGKHKSYFVTFCQNFVSGVKGLIKADIEKQNKFRAKKRIIYDEILYHLHSSESKCQVFAGRDEILQSVKQNLDDQSKSNPLVLHSDSGGGKSYIIAKVFDLLPVWYGKNICRVIRFLGTSALSSDIYDVLKSVILQVAKTYNIVLQPDNYKNMQSLIKFIPRIIRIIARSTNEKIFILLDSIDQLSANDEAHKMNWLPVDLPSNVHIIISTLTGLLDNSKKRLSSVNLIQILPVSHVSSGEQIIKAYLDRQNRTLQKDQKEVILKAFHCLPNMLYLKLLMDKAITWQSHMPVDVETIASSTHEAITQLFTKLENKYGFTLVSRTLGYITADENGLTVSELEDVLSCDNEVLNEVYQYHAPPIEGIIRIPALLWARIHNELREYLAEGNSYGKTTMYWCNRQFTETATERYMHGDIVRELHSNLAELFLAEHGIKKDIVLSRLRVPRTISNADRQIHNQPLVAENVRALMAIPYHLKQSNECERLLKDCLFRLKFLLAKIQALGKESILRDLKEAFDVENKNPDVECLRICLQSMNEKKENYVSITTELLLNLPHSDELLHCHELVQQGKKFLTDQQGIKVIPLHGSLWNKTCNMEIIDNIQSVISVQGDIVLVETNSINKDEYSFSALDVGKEKVKCIWKAEGMPAVKPSVNKILAYHNNLKNDQDVESMKDVTSLSYVYFKYSNKEKTSTGKEKQNIKLIDSHVGANKNFQINLVQESSLGKYITLVIDNNQIITEVEENKWAYTFKIVGSNVKNMATTSLHDRAAEIKISGDNVEIAFASYIEEHRKTLFLAKTSHLKRTTSNRAIIGLIDHTNFAFKSVEFHGEPMKDKWKILQNGSLFALPILANRSTSLVTVKTDDCSSSSLDLDMGGETVCDISYSSADEMKCFAVSETTVKSYVIETKEEIMEIKHNVKSAKVITVQDDGQFVYIGNQLGEIHSWNIENNQFIYLGSVQLPCSGINGIYLTNFNAKLLIETSENKLIAMKQNNLITNSKPKTLLKSCHNSGLRLQSLDSLSDCVLLTLVNSDGNPNLTTFQVGNYKQWPLGEIESVKTVSYGNSFKDFFPDKVLYDSGLSTSLCMISNSQNALVVNFDNQSLKSVDIQDSTIIATTHGTKAFYLLTKSGDGGMLKILVVNYSSGNDVAKVIVIEGKLQYIDVDIILTPNEKLLALKVLCPDQELQAINASIKKFSSAITINAKSKYKFYGLDLSKTSASLTPCLRKTSDTLRLGNEFAAYQNSTVLLALGPAVYQWDLSTGKTSRGLVRETKQEMFKQPMLSENIAEDIECIETSKTKKDGVLVATGTSNGWFSVFKSSGENIAGNVNPKVPNHSSLVKKVLISPDNSWVASITTNNLLRFWAIKDKCANSFCDVQLDTDVKQVEVDNTGQYVVVLGQIPYQGTKIYAMNINI